MAAEKTQNQALEQTRDSVLRYGESVGCELLNFFVIPRNDIMPHYGAKVSSAYISSDAIREFLAALPSVMRDIKGDRPLTVSYQWGCFLDNDLCFTPMCWPLDLFPVFLADSIHKNIVTLGESELLIVSEDASLRILVCHESDIHLDGTDDEAIAKIMARFPQLDFRTAAEWEAALPRNKNPSPQAPG